MTISMDYVLPMTQYSIPEGVCMMRTARVASVHEVLPLEIICDDEQRCHPVMGYIHSTS
jgi:(p)ppGpp synthase/HD superfamily hydrolase